MSACYCVWRQSKKSMRFDKKISADINNATLILIGICSGMRRYNAYVVVSSRFCRLSVSDAAGLVLSLAKSYKCSSSCPPTKSELSSPLPMWVEALDVAVWLSWPFSSLLFDPCDKKLNLSDSRSCKNATQYLDGRPNLNDKRLHERSLPGGFCWAH